MKKGQGMSLNVIIVSALSLLILVVLAIIFTGINTQMIEAKNVSEDPTYFFREPAFNRTGVDGIEHPRRFEVAYFEKTNYVIYCCKQVGNESFIMCKQDMTPEIDVRVGADGKVGFSPILPECSKVKYVT